MNEDALTYFLWNFFFTENVNQFSEFENNRLSGFSQ